jgi:hypothetical protein
MANRGMWCLSIHKFRMKSLNMANGWLLVVSLIKQVNHTSVCSAKVVQISCCYRGSLSLALCQHSINWLKLCYWLLLRKGKDIQVSSLEGNVLHVRLVHPFTSERRIRLLQWAATLPSQFVLCNAHCDPKPAFCCRFIHSWDWAIWGKWTAYFSDFMTDHLLIMMEKVSFPATGSLWFRHRWCQSRAGWTDCLNRTSTHWTVL